MKRNFRPLVAAFLGLCLRTVAASDPAGPEAALARVDALYEFAVKENYHPAGLALMEDSLSLCKELLDADPSSYDLLWRSARSALELAETAKILRNKDWKGYCADLARQGIAWTDAAKTAEPGSVEGYFWQMKAMGLLYEAEGAIAFIAKGYASGSRQNLDACCAIDPSYLDYTPILAKALYLYSAPAFLGRDMNQALICFDEFAGKTRWTFEPYKQYPEAAELLLSTKKADRVEQARTLLLAALADPTPRPHYYDIAAALLAKLEKASR
ncbi:MAG TPA: hypothetical protein VN445_09195 [Rectinemataceae bacterium]|nr:hypothetical protein [Rectinemataceae bacterium]